jgi:hypothetical protein
MSVLNSLKNKYKGKDCVVLTCGPSLKEYSKKKLIGFFKDKVVICIKEAILEYGDHCDIFFQNSTRDRYYDIDDKVFKIYQSRHRREMRKDMNYDLILDEILSLFTKDKQLLVAKKFEDFILDKNPGRPWGPGILYESVFYFCKHIGIKNVYTVGWDLIDTTKTHCIEHYFDDSKDIKYKSSGRWGNRDFRDEMILVNNELPYLYKFFKNKGLNISVCGKQSYVNKIIPRYYL